MRLRDLIKRRLACAFRFMLRPIVHQIRSDIGSLRGTMLEHDRLMLAKVEQVSNLADLLHRHTMNIEMLLAREERQKLRERHPV